MTKNQAVKKALAHERRARALHNQRHSLLHSLLIRIEVLQSKAESLKGKAQREADLANHYLQVYRDHK